MCRRKTLASPSYLEPHGGGPVSQSFLGFPPGFAGRAQLQDPCPFFSLAPTSLRGSSRSRTSEPAKVVPNMGASCTVLVTCSLGSCCRVKALFSPDEPTLTVSSCAASVRRRPRHHVPGSKQAAELFTFCEKTQC